MIPCKIIDAGKELILIDALAGVVGNEYIRGVDQLVTVIRLAGDGGTERQIDGQALNGLVYHLIDAGLLVVISFCEIRRCR